MSNINPVYVYLQENAFTDFLANGWNRAKTATLNGVDHVKNGVDKLRQRSRLASVKTNAQKASEAKADLDKIRKGKARKTKDVFSWKNLWNNVTGKPKKAIHKKVPLTPQEKRERLNSTKSRYEDATQKSNATAKANARQFVRDTRSAIQARKNNIEARKAQSRNAIEARATAAQKKKASLQASSALLNGIS